MLGKRPQNSPPPTMLIKNQIGSKKPSHIFTAKEVTPLKLTPETIKQEHEQQQQQLQEARQNPPKCRRLKLSFLASKCI